MNRSSVQFMPGLLVLLSFFIPLPAHGQSIVYPIEIGDTWIYQEAHSSHPDTVTIERDTVLPNRISYAYFRNSKAGFFSQFQRRVGNQVLAYDTHRDTEVVMLDFGQTRKDTLGSYMPFNLDTLDIVFFDSSVMTVFGLPRAQWLFGYHWRHLQDASWSNTITDSIGLTREEDFWFYYTLIGARVNGRSYGIITSTPNFAESHPSDFRLYQNYPNPFNPVSTIAYFLPRRARAVLEVYNVLGQSVATIVNAVLEPGLHESVFDGSQLPSGVYFYRLRIDEFVLTRPMILQK